MGLGRIKMASRDRTYQIGESLLVLSFAIAGAVIARFFYETRKANESARPSGPMVSG